jgi:ATP-dependent DNA helicase RecQ
VVLRDEHFKEESEDIEETFERMDDESVIEHHKAFVMGVGGIWKEGEVTVNPKAGIERMQKESTYHATKELLMKRLDAGMIARERNMALSTIWSHIEKLAEDGEISHEHLRPLIPSSLPAGKAGLSWEDVYGEMSEAFRKEGTEKLKPVFEALGERYDYDVIRLGRIFYTLK